MMSTSGLKSVIAFFRGWIAEVVTRTLRDQLIKAQRRRKAAQAQASLGDITSGLTAEVDPIGAFAAEALNTPLIQGGVLLGVFGFMLVAETELAVIAGAAFVAEATATPILQFYINKLTCRRIQSLRRMGRDVIRARGASRRAHFIDSLSLARIVYRIRLQMNLLKALLKFVRSLIAHTADVAVLTYGAWLIMNGKTQIGVIVAFLSALREARDPWKELVSFYRRWSDARVKYRLVSEALSER